MEIIPESTKIIDKGTPEGIVNLDQSPGKMTIDPNLDHDDTKAPNRPAMDLDDNNDMKGFKKAS